MNCLTNLLPNEGFPSNIPVKVTPQFSHETETSVLDANCLSLKFVIYWKYVSCALNLSDHIRHFTSQIKYVYANLSKDYFVC